MDNWHNDQLVGALGNGRGVSWLSPRLSRWLRAGFVPFIRGRRVSYGPARWRCRLWGFELREGLGWRRSIREWWWIERGRDASWCKVAEAERGSCRQIEIDVALCPLSCPSPNGAVDILPIVLKSILWPIFPYLHSRVSSHPASYRYESAL
jgi:hypothetical protein